MKIIRIWFIYALMGAQTQLLSGWSGLLFIVGKLVRFFLFFLFVYSVMSASNRLMGYTDKQVVVFFLIFIILDALIQVIYRGIYNFRPLIVSGNFDLDLLHPLPSYYRPIFGVTDILDIITTIPFVGYFIWYIIGNGLSVSWSNLLLFLLLSANALLLAFAVNLIIAAVGLLTTEIDHLTSVYRDLEAMARFPTDIYNKGIQYLITYVIPIVILINIPAKAFLGLLVWPDLLLAFGVTAVFLLLAIRLWRFGLSKYSSASS